MSGPAVAGDDMPARERVVEPGGKPAAPGNRQRFMAQPVRRCPSAAVADHHLGDAGGRRRHRMAVEQQRAAETLDKPGEGVRHCLVKGAVRLAEPSFKVAEADLRAP